MTAYLGFGTRTEPFGERSPELYFLRHRAGCQCLLVGVAHGKIHRRAAFAEHVIDRIATATAHADDLDLVAGVFRLGDKPYLISEYRCHIISCLRIYC